MTDNRQRARELLEEIELFSDRTDFQVALHERYSNISKNGVDEYQLRELRTRLRAIKEAFYCLEYELSAFVSATYRHGKGENNE